MKINWPEINTVLLDMDGVLLDLHYDNYFWQEYLLDIYSKKNQLPAEIAKQEFVPLFKKHAGTLNWYSVDFWSELLDVDIMKHKTDVAHKIAFRPQAREFLKHCQQQVEDLRLITNGHRKVLDLKIQQTQIDQYFEEMICSHELGAAKESQDFWQQLQNRREFDLDRTLFIDDSEAVLDAANDHGIKHIYSIAKPDSKAERASASKYAMLEKFLTG